MPRRYLLKTLVALVLAVLHSAVVAEIRPIWVSGAEGNDLVVALRKGGAQIHRMDTPAGAIDSAARGGAVLLLADGYPDDRLTITEEIWKGAEKKELKVYVEFPSWLPGMSIGATRATEWERLIVAREMPSFLNEMQILVAHDCHYAPMEVDNPFLVVAKVAGYNRALFGLPPEVWPVLFAWPNGNVLVATTKLSGFTSGRYAPVKEWEALWGWMLRELGVELSIRYEPTVSAAYKEDQPLPGQWQRDAVRKAVKWQNQSGLLISRERWPKVKKQLLDGVEIAPEAGPLGGGGDGTLGILEGYSSKITFEGHQRQRLPIRADCQAESAMVYASDHMLAGDRTSGALTTNLLEFLYQTSGMHGGVRGDPEHPAFGLISWGAIAPAWEVANYGDDNARAMLATMFAAGALRSDQWDESLLKALLANLRTTGRLGFRGDRIDIGALEQNGWKHYNQSATINYSPHFEAYSWACFLWAYRHTGHEPFLRKTKTAIEMTMKAYPDGWRWNDNMERAHMLLPLAWLLHLENTEEHRKWLKAVAFDLLAVQNECGALGERFRTTGGHYQVPGSNEAYGTTETPLIQEAGDPVSDQLYVSGFALLGLHEAAAALDDNEIREGADRLAEYLARIQTRSEKYPYLDGSWFRAFDFERWEAWASSADVGWGAWCVEAGWAQAWGLSTMALREKNTTLWDLTAGSKIAKSWDKVIRLMTSDSEN